MLLLQARRPSVSFSCNGSGAAVLQERCMEPTTCYQWPEQEVCAALWRLLRQILSYKLGGAAVVYWLPDSGVSRGPGSTPISVSIFLNYYYYYLFFLCRLARFSSRTANTSAPRRARRAWAGSGRGSASLRPPTTPPGRGWHRLLSSHRTFACPTVQAARGRGPATSLPAVARASPSTRRCCRPATRTRTRASGATTPSVSSAEQRRVSP